MKFIVLISSLTITFFASCNSGNKTDADYVKNLEEKNRRLQQELENKSVQQDYNAPVYTPSPNTNQYSNNYFTIGSTEDEVIQVMGDPTSVHKFESLKEKMFFYGTSIVTFRNGKVKEYSNNGNNLRVKYKSTNENQSDENISTTTKKQTSNTKYIYFSCLLEEFREYQSYYSQIYSVTNFTDDKALEIQNCLVEQIKFFTHTEDKVVLIKHEFNSLSAASAKWNDETGKKIFGDGGCYIKPFNE